MSPPIDVCKLTFKTFDISKNLRHSLSNAFSFFQRYGFAIGICSSLVSRDNVAQRDSISAHHTFLRSLSLALFFHSRKQKSTEKDRERRNNGIEIDSLSISKRQREEKIMTKSHCFSKSFLLNRIKIFISRKLKLLLPDGEK